MGIVSLENVDILGFSYTVVPDVLHCTIQSSKTKLFKNEHSQRVSDMTCKQPVTLVLNSPKTMKSRQQKFCI